MTVFTPKRIGTIVSVIFVCIVLVLILPRIYEMATR